MVGKESPCIAGGFCSPELDGKPFQEIIPVLVIEEYFVPVDSWADDVV